MESSTWIAIYLPLFILFVIILPNQRRMAMAVIRRKRKRGISSMSNVLIESAVGHVCNISTGSFGSNYSKVKVVEVVDHWIKINKKGKEELINAEYIQSIAIVE